MGKPFFHLQNPRSRTGCVGVSLSIRRSRSRKGEVVLRRFFVARLSFAGRTLVSMCSIDTLGASVAWRRAVRQRMRWERECAALQTQALAAHAEVKRRYPNAPWVWPGEIARINQAIAKRRGI